MSAVLSAAAGAVLLTASPAAATQGEVEVFVDPERVRAGHPVRITATGCITDSPDTISEAYSDVFPSIALEPYEGGEAGTIGGTTRVFQHARPGTYTVNVACDVTQGASASGSVTVVR